MGDIPGSVDSASTELLRHKFIRFDENVGTPLFSAYIPEKVE